MFKKCWGIQREKGLGSKMTCASRKEGYSVGVGPVKEQVVESNDLHGGQRLVWVRDMARVGVE
jgi:hypothetical protein